MVFYQETRHGQNMPRPRNIIPQYSLHKKSGLARCTWQGDTVYLGQYNSPESISRYNQILSVFALTGKIRQETKCVHVAEVFTQFLSQLKVANEAMPREIKNMGYAFRYAENLFGTLPGNEFRASQLVMVRDAMINEGLRRTTINKYQRYIVRAFRFGVRADLVPGATLDSLKALETLKKRRSTAIESERVRPVAWEAVKAIEGHCPRQVWAMILLQWNTGMRPGEVCMIRPCDIDRTGPIWFYRPEFHKTAYREKERVIGLGPKCQAILAPWLDRPADLPCFSPSEAEANRKAAMRAARKSKVQPSQVDRSKQGATRKPGAAYDVASYRRVIVRACQKLSVEPWNPNQLRHTFATRARKEFGLDAAQVALGHEHADVTQVYAEADLQAIREIATKLS